MYMHWLLLVLNLDLELEGVLLASFLRLETLLLVLLLRLGQLDPDLLVLDLGLDQPDHWHLRTLLSHGTPLLPSMLFTLLLRVLPLELEELNLHLDMHLVLLLPRLLPFMLVDQLEKRIPLQPLLSTPPPPLIW